MFTIIPNIIILVPKVFDLLMINLQPVVKFYERD